ncbi:hypothetical protein BROUX41_002458 [Berkeleyomyces rouxiae]|uniref:uncharacterized protein n=1 Tax=Berkeleyomyces rouxiae TaxID=2035830 RepID=UPI003B788E4D
MPPPSPAQASHDDDENSYNSADDSDFAPGEADDNISESGGSDYEGEAKATVIKQAKPSKRKGSSDGDVDSNGVEFENSGDEAIISKAKKKKRRERANAEDEGGEGGLIKTRRQRATEKAERKDAVPSGPVTIDVDSMFASMMTGNFATDPEPRMDIDTTNNAEQHVQVPIDGKDEYIAQAQAQKAPPEATSDADMILIKRKYNFAGKVHTEEKLVKRFSAEAKLYLDSLTPEEAAAVLSNTATTTASDGEKDAMERTPRKAFRSRFEPAIEQITQRPDLQLGVALRLQAREEAKTAAAAARAKKLNTVEKSRMDWAGYVDKEGLKDELVSAGKAKDSFAERQDFLARTEAKREEEARRARMSARAQQQAL